MANCATCNHGLPAGNGAGVYCCAPRPFWVDQGHWLLRPADYAGRACGMYVRASDATAPAPGATQPAFQRGDIVAVARGVGYRGVLRFVRGTEAYVITRNYGEWIACTQLTRIERRGRRKAATLYEWAQAFPAPF